MAQIGENYFLSAKNWMVDDSEYFKLRQTIEFWKNWKNLF